MENREEILLNALAHGLRREIVRFIKAKGSATYTQIMDKTELSTGKLNYHLKQLSGLLEKNASDNYVLTPLGEKAVVILEALNVSGLDEYFERMKKAQTLSPFMRGLFRGGIVVTILVLAFWGFMGYMAYTEGAPLAVWVILAVLYGLGAALLVFLVNASRSVPAYIEKVERRISGDST